MTIYTIAITRRETYGHGHFGEEDKICRISKGWDMNGGKFPPAFTSKTEAEKFLKANYPYDAKVVEMELIK